MLSRCDVGLSLLVNGTCGVLVFLLGIAVAHLRVTPLVHNCTGNEHC